MQLAELNISKWKVDPVSDAARGFVDYVERVNGLAEHSPGFVWRLEDEQRDKDGKNPVCEDNDTLMTLSVWETAQDLEHFVWKTLHKRIYNQKEQWFSQMTSHTLVMWWVEPGHLPGLDEAKQRLDHLDVNGDSDHAFGWSHLPHINQWQEQKCG